MHVLYASDVPSRLRPVPLRIDAQSCESARFAHRVAHTTGDKWRPPGADIPEVWHRRRRFLKAAAAFRPELLSEYRELVPLAREAAEVVTSAPPRRTYANWRDVQMQANLARDFGDDLPDGISREPVLAFEAALSAWADRWHLVSTACSGELTDSWVLEAAAGVLCNPLYDGPPPLTIPGFGWTPPLPAPSVDERIACLIDFDKLDPKLHDEARKSALRRVAGTGFRFDVPSWDGDEASDAWLSRQLEAIKSVLERHVAMRLDQAENLGLERIPRMRTGGHDHLERAARWQVGGEAWDAFLMRERREDKTVHRVRAGMLEQLRFVGIEPRPGMRTT